MPLIDDTKTIESAFGMSFEEFKNLNIEEQQRLIKTYNMIHQKSGKKIDIIIEYNKDLSKSKKLTKIRK